MIPPSLAATMDIATPVALEKNVCCTSKFWQFKYYILNFNQSTVTVAPKQRGYLGVVYDCFIQISVNWHL
jgi:hypothetical protein